MGLGGIFRFAKNQAKAVLPGVAADKKKPWIPGPPDKKPDGVPLAPGPSSLAAPAPPDAGLAASNAQLAAHGAAKKLRRKITNTGMVKPSSIATASTSAVRSLAGY